MTDLRDLLIESITEKILATSLNGHPTERLPNNINLTFDQVDGESLLLYLNEHQIYASAGSACTANSIDVSHVLVAIGLSKEQAQGSIRFSLGKSTTVEDIDKVIEVIPGIVNSLRKISTVNLIV